MLRLAQFAAGLLFASCVQAQVYKCVDAAGKVIYAQTPCPANTKSGTITRRLDAAPAAPPAEAPAEKAGKGGAPKSAAPKSAAEQDQAFRKRQQEQEKAAKEAEQKSAEAKRKEDNCRNARERLAQYEIGGRITRINAQGERVYYDDAQIEQQKAAARADVAQSCN